MAGVGEVNRVSYSTQPEQKRKFFVSSKIQNPIVSEKALYSIAHRQDAASTAKNEAGDGKISFDEGLKSFGKGLISPITSMFSSWTNFAIGAGMIAAGAGIAASGGGALLVIGGALYGGYELIKGGYKAANAKTDDEAKEAWENIGAGTSAVGLSALGAKAAFKGSGAAASGKSSKFSWQTLKNKEANQKAAPTESMPQQTVKTETMPAEDSPIGQPVKTEVMPAADSPVGQPVKKPAATQTVSNEVLSSKIADLKLDPTSIQSKRFNSFLGKLNAAKTEEDHIASLIDLKEESSILMNTSLSNEKLSALDATLAEMLKAKGVSVQGNELVGQPFDPTFHNSYNTELTLIPKNDNKIARVLTDGYSTEKGCLRPANVVVYSYRPRG